MSDLVAFLRARVDEDEAYLKSNARHLWTQRPLWEVEAKRAILAQWEDLHPVADSLLQEQHHGVYAGDGEYTLGAYAALTAAVRQLAAVYRDHPDYDPKWAV